MIEALAPAIEGIGHIARAGLGRVVEEQAHLVQLGFRRKPDQLVVIGIVHGKDQVEAAIVRGRDLPRTLARDVHAAVLGGGLRARVGRLADMPIAHAGRVDLEAVDDALFLGDTTEHAFGHGRAADIAETDEQETVLCHAG